MVKKESTEMAKPVDTEVVSATEAFITKLVNAKREGFLKANEGLDLDFVYFTKWLSIDSKGNFVEKNGNEVVHSFGDSIDVLIARDEQKFSLWGEEDSDEDGELIVAENTREEAEKRFLLWLENNPTAKERYSINSIQSRYIAFVVPIKSLSKGQDVTLYTLGMAPTSKMAYGQWAYAIYSGNPTEIAKGIPAGTGVNRVVVRITTVAKVNKFKQNYLALEFATVEMFDPSKI